MSALHINSFPALVRLDPASPNGSSAGAETNVIAAVAKALADLASLAPGVRIAVTTGDGREIVASISPPGGSTLESSTGQPSAEPVIGTGLTGPLPYTAALAALDEAEEPL